MTKQRSYGTAKQHFFMEAQMSEVLEEEPVKPIAGTKVVVTIGPACQDVETLSKLLLAGVSCARIDLTWGTPKFHRTSLNNLNAAMRATKRLCAVFLDTTGREICVHRPMSIDESGWMSQKETISFKKGEEVVITNDMTQKATSKVLPVNVPKFCELVEPGQTLHIGRFLSTGAEGSSLFLKVVHTTCKEIHCVAENSASIDGLLCILVCHREFRLHQHDHDLNAQLPLLTATDVACLQEFGRDFEIDFVSLSYCNSAEDVYSARDTLDALGMTSTKIVAKVERKAAIHNFNAIVSAADAIIFSRGNLGIDFEPEEMAQLQKLCINRCNSLGKSIIVTRVVDTMVNTPRPTRAEATDVANAVLDGCDGVLLGAETLRGLYPVDTVDTVVKLCACAERYFDYRNHHEEMLGEAYEEDAVESSFGSTVNLTSYSPGHKEAQRRGLMAARAISYADLAGAVGPACPLPRSTGETGSQSMVKASSFGVLPRTASMDGVKGSGKDSNEHFMAKLESIASSAARVAEKIDAGLIIVLAQTGRTVSLVAKYRPPMPVLAVVVPTLKSHKLGWKLEGKYLARQCLVMRGVNPLMAAPNAKGGREDMLGEAVAAAVQQGLVTPNKFVVSILSVKGDLMLKVVQVNHDGTGIKSTDEGMINFDLVDTRGANGAAMNGAEDANQAAAMLSTLSMRYSLDSPYSGMRGATEFMASPPTSPSALNGN